MRFGPGMFPMNIHAGGARFDIAVVPVINPDGRKINVRGIANSNIARQAVQRGRNEYKKQAA